MWNDKIKFAKAISALKDGTEYSYSGDAPTNAEEYEKINWKTGEDAGGSMISTTTNPHSELTWSKVSTKMTELQTEYEGLTYARAREESYPITKEFIEAYTEKEIGGDSTKWDAYVVKYNKVRSDNQKP